MSMERRRFLGCCWKGGALVRAAFLGVLVVGALASGAACDKSPESETSGAGAGKSSAKSKGLLCLSVLTLDNPFFKVIGDTLAAEGKKQGFDVLVVSGQQNVATQQSQVKDFIVRKAAAIILSPCDSKAIGPVIQEANDAKIPVFTIDIASQAQGAKVVCHIATDNLGGGREAARAMIEALGESGGDVAVLDYKSVESCLLRVQGFKEIVAEHNKTATQPIRIVTELPCEGDKDRGYRSTLDAMSAHPNIAGIFAINDPAALGARAALEKLGKADGVRIIGFDGFKEGKQAIKDGKIWADPIQFPDEMARQTLAAIVKYFDGEPVPPQILIPTKLYRKADGEKDPELE
jgi:ribose transport system substrate-binding protein